MKSPSLRFAETARVLSSTAHREGLAVPVFRNRPQQTAGDRTLRRQRTGDVVVSVRLTGRPFAAVQSDLIEGLVVVNGLDGADAQRIRATLWNDLARSGQVEGGPSLAAA